jgi:hypothetical protein
VDAITGLPYVSDADFIDTGVSHNVSAEYVDASLPRPHYDLRSFPTGARNCYTVRPLTPGTKYLVRATFLHGNYDGLGDGGLAVFDLYLGVNLWRTVNISSVSSTFRAEIISVVPDDYVHVCLVGKKGLGTPFISGLELRPLADELYPIVANASMSMDVHGRHNLGPEDESLIIRHAQDLPPTSQPHYYKCMPAMCLQMDVNFRYPDDPHDRIWKVLANPRSWIPTNTTAAVLNVAQDQFLVPSAVMQTAATVDDGFSLQFYWDADDSNKAFVYYVALHFAEVRALNSSEARICEIYLNNDLWYSKPISPVYLYSGAVFGTVTGKTQYNYRIEPTNNSTLPPIMNALEIFLMVPTAERATDGGDGRVLNRCLCGLE